MRPWRSYNYNSSILKREQWLSLKPFLFARSDLITIISDTGKGKRSLSGKPVCSFSGKPVGKPVCIKCTNCSTSASKLRCEFQGCLILMLQCLQVSMKFNLISTVARDLQALPDLYCCTISWYLGVLLVRELREVG